MHTLSTKETLDKLQVKETQGLSNFEAESRQEKYGANEIEPPKPKPWWLILLRQLNSPLVYIMLIAAFISFFLHHYLDMWVILAASGMNIFIGFWQEQKASRTLESLKKIVAWNAKVIRDSKPHQVDSRELVPGDILILKAGDRVAADARLLSAEELKLNEAALTGESMGQEKKVDEVLPTSTPVGDRVNMVYSGTLVLKGTGKAVVTSIAHNTEFGKIAQSLRDTEETLTPLQNKVKQFTKWLGYFAGFVVAIIMLIGWLSGHSFEEMFITSIAVAVSAVPEGLLSAVIVVLAIGLWRMARRNALIRTLSSAETLGSTTVICTDKTGTLTEGKMSVVEIRSHSCRGDEDAKFNPRALAKACPSERQKVLEIGLLNNDAYIENPEDNFSNWKIIGDPTEQALLVAASQAGMHQRDLQNKKPRIKELPFDSERKFMLTLHENTNGKGEVIFIKGAPEKVLPMCDKELASEEELKLEELTRTRILENADKMSKRGLRVLAVGYKKISSNQSLKLSDETQGFTYVGMFGMKDPLRPSAKKAILRTRQAGIRVMMMTGDHKFTARAIATELGLPVKEKNIAEGKEIQLVDGTVNTKKIKDIYVFARVSPQDKLHIVDALQKSGEIVAMTGDGVNDAPALKKADIGIAVGSGTDVSKEVADMVLLDDDYASIEKAVVEGRGIMENIRKVVLYLLSDTFSEVLIISFSLLVGLPLPLLATQILWINLVDDGLPGMSLAFEPKEEGLMDQPPRSPKEPLLTKPMRWLIGVISIFTASTLVLLFWWYLHTGHSLEEARTVAFTLLGVDSLLYVFSIRSFRHTIFSSHILGNKWLLGACTFGLLLQLAAIYLPPLQKAFQTVALGWDDWLWILGTSGLLITLIELVKIHFIGTKSKEIKTFHKQLHERGL